MTLWLIRAGKHGEREALALEKGLAIIGWEDLPDLGALEDRDSLATALGETYPDQNPKTLSNWESQLWPFARVIQEGDLVVLPLKTRATIALGRVKGPYRHRNDLSDDPLHTRPIEWLGEYPRSHFDQDLRYSFGAFMTVCRVQRNRAEERVKAIISGKPGVSAVPELPTGEETVAEEALPDIEQFARDQIRDFIARKFKGHELANLVAALLTAQGYQVRVSPEGPDGGVDIIAGRGLLGFDPPRLAVQVKSGDAPIDVKVIREMQGVMKNFGAQQGLVVAWGGYRQSVAREAARLFFEVRLWDSADLVRMIQAHYDDLPDAIQADLPMKRVWMLVSGEE